MTIASPPDDLSVKLDRWVASGIITAEQAARIRADEQRSADTGQPVDNAPPPVQAPPPAGTAEPAERRVSLVAEAMGYLGGVIILVASGLVASRVWGHLAVGARIGLAGAVAALLFVAGRLVPATLGAPGRRLRAVLWLASSVALFSCLMITGTEGFGWHDRVVALVAGAGTAVYSAALWSVHRHLLQNLATFTALLVTIAALADLLPNEHLLPEVAMWAAGVVWIVLSWGSVIGPRPGGFVIGAVTAVVNAAVLMSETWGVVLALATVAGLIAVAVAFRDLALLGVASVGALYVLPRTMSRFFPGVLSAAFALLLVGVVLVVVAVITARRRRDVPTADDHDWSSGTPGTASVIAGSVAAVTAVAVVVAGL